MFSSLFQGINVESLYCHLWEFSKCLCIFPVINKRISAPLHLIHRNIWGLPPVARITGSRWFISFIGYCTRVTSIFLMKNKSKVGIIVPSFHFMIQNQFVTKIKCFCSNMQKNVLVTLIIILKMKALFMNLHTFIVIKKME